MARKNSRRVRLSPVERGFLMKIVRTGSHPAQHVRRARILLELDENDPDLQGPVPTQAMVAERAGVNTDIGVKVTEAYIDRGGHLEDTITRKKRLAPPVEPTIAPSRDPRADAAA